MIIIETIVVELNFWNLADGDVPEPESERFETVDICCASNVVQKASKKTPKKDYYQVNGFCRMLGLCECRHSWAQVLVFIYYYLQNFKFYLDD